MTKLRRFLGRSALVVGVISTVVFLSPIFPIGVEALLVGGLFFGAGAWALAAPDIRGALRRFIRTVPRSSVSIDPLLPVRILRLAAHRQGTLSVSEVAIELDVPLDQAQEGLRVCVRAGSATEDFDLSRGYSLFRFPEFSEPSDRQLPL
jgi:hypothetical protein